MNCLSQGILWKSNLMLLWFPCYKFSARLDSFMNFHNFHFMLASLALSLSLSISLCLAYGRKTFSIFYVLFVLRFAYCFATLLYTQPAVVNCYNNNNNINWEQQMSASGNFNFLEPSDFMKRIITQISIKECQAASPSHSHPLSPRSLSQFLSHF